MKNCMSVLKTTMILENGFTGFYLSVLHGELYMYMNMGSGLHLHMPNIKSFWGHKCILFSPPGCSTFFSVESNYLSDFLEK